MLFNSGKTKILYDHNDNCLLCTFTDKITANNNATSMVLEGKGAIVCKIDRILQKILQQRGIPTHFVSKHDDTSHIVKGLRMFKLEFVVRFYADGSFEKRFKLPHHYKFEAPIIELFYKSDELEDPFISENAAINMGFISQENLSKAIPIAESAAIALREVCDKIRIQLIDVKFELGLDASNNVVIGDEISPDSFRAINEGGQYVDKQAFRNDKNADIVKIYKSFLYDLEKFVLFEV